MIDPLISRFADACGATGPLDLRVDLVDGGVLADGSVAQPFALVGRDDACDVTLTDPDVNLRHAWFQVAGGRVFVADLGSRTGLVWPTGATGPGWLDPGTPVRIGPFRVHLKAAGGRPRSAGRGNPLQADPEAVRGRPAVALDFRNGRRVRDRWTVNRLVTLVGRSPDCKIHLNADDIAGYHCGLVLTPTGLWVVDLSGRGVVVNGERMRVAPLPHGAELWVGRFLVSCGYPSGTPSSPPGRPAPLTASADRRPYSLPAEDEVPLGFAPPADPAAGLPSSHIMADAFWLRTGGPVTNGVGPVSSPILVTGSDPAPLAVPVHPAPRLVTTPDPAVTGPPSAMLMNSAAAAADPLLGTLVRHLAEIHGQMGETARRTLTALITLAGHLPRERAAQAQAELSRLLEIGRDIDRLLPDLTPSWVAPSAHTPLPDDETVVARVVRLEQERQARWHGLYALFAGPIAANGKAHGLRAVGHKG